MQRQLSGIALFPWVVLINKTPHWNASVWSQMKNMYHLRSNTGGIFYLVFQYVSRFIHLTQMVVFYWLLTAWILNKFQWQGDPDLQIRERGAGHLNPEIRGEGGLQKKIFWPFKPQSRSKNKWGGDRPLPWICHWVNYNCSSHFPCFISFSGPCCRCRRFIKMWHVRWQSCCNGCQKQLGGSVDVWLYTGLRRNWTNEVGC